MGFNQYLVSKRRYVVARIDGRGTGYRGWMYKAPVLYSLQTLEIEDQLTAVKLLANQFSFIDTSKIAVWGWSYGGTVSAKMLKLDKENFFKCAASVSPVTDSRYYDAPYTERYMRSLEENPQGYENTKIYTNATDYVGKNYLLIHGTNDDNVHLQNSYVLIKALTEVNAQFKLMIYADENHSIGKRRLHLFTMLDNYFIDCFA